MAGVNPMSLFPFVHFFTFILLMYHAVYIFFKNPKALLNRICAAFIFCFGFWSFAYIFVHNPYYSKNTAKTFLNISSFGWVGFAGLFLWFILVFTQKKKLLKKNWPVHCLRRPSGKVILKTKKLFSGPGREKISPCFSQTLY